MNFDDKVIDYTVQFCNEAEVDVDPVALKSGIKLHLNTARQYVTDDTLEAIGHKHIATMINTAARYKLTLGEVILECIKDGVQPVSVVCSSLHSRKSSVKKIHKPPHLRVIKN